MIGRVDDIRELALALEGATHCVIAGPRRTGKTSVCDAALLHAARRGHYVARVGVGHIFFSTLRPMRAARDAISLCGISSTPLLQLVHAPC